MSKSKSNLATHNDTLRAFLLVAIQDESFDTVRDNIVNSPSNSVDVILQELQKRETSLVLCDSDIYINVNIYIYKNIKI